MVPGEITRISLLFQRGIRFIQSAGRAGYPYPLKDNSQRREEPAKGRGGPT